MTTQEVLQLAIALSIAVLGAYGWFIRTLSNKVDGLMTRVARVETRIDHVPDTEKVREIVGDVMEPVSRKLDHLDEILSEVRVTVNTTMARRRREDD